MKSSPQSKALHKAMQSQKAGLLGVQKILPKIEKAAGAIAKRPGKLIVIGVGKSSYIAMKTASSMVSLGIRASFLHPAEAVHGDAGIVESGDSILAYSYSGESLEVTKLIRHLRRHHELLVVSVTGTPSSSLGKQSDLVIPLTVKSEGSPRDIAPMASTLATLAVGDLLAVSMVSADFETTRFARAHPGGAIGLSLTPVSSVMTTGKKIPYVTMNASATSAIREISKKKLGITGVVTEAGVLRGVITDGDLRRFIARHSSLAGVSAVRLMSKKPKTIPEAASLKEALSLMERHKITSLFVCDAKKHPLGIVHIHDIVES